MPLQFITSNNDDSVLPWAREFIKSDHDSDVSRVVRVVRAEKGHVVYTEDFKGYAWKNSKLVSALISTLNTFRLYPELQTALYARAHKDGSISLAVDPDTIGEYAWQTDKDWNEWICTPTASENLDANSTATLLPPEMLEMLEKIKQQPREPQDQNGQNAPSRKPKKAHNQE